WGGLARHGGRGFRALAARLGDRGGGPPSRPAPPARGAGPSRGGHPSPPVGPPTLLGPPRGGPVSWPPAPSCRIARAAAQPLPARPSCSPPTGSVPSAVVSSRDWPPIASALSPRCARASWP